MIIERKNYSIEVSEPTVHVDNKSRSRSGHMSHAMVEYAPGKVLDFNSNCSAELYSGHSAFGFIEYRYSDDGGETFGEIHELEYSKRALLDGVNTISLEKAVVCDNGRIVAFCLRNDAHNLCEPWNTPMVIMSDDAGKTWTKEKELCSEKGRVYDAVYHKGVIYALEFCNDGREDFCGTREYHLYRIYTSKNNGESFEELCVIPMQTYRRGYGAMVFDKNDDLHVYTYNVSNERFMDHLVSHDFGKTWEMPATCFLPMGIRNPQVALMDGIFILHGRNAEFAGCDGLVLYTSEDGYTWDEGAYLFRAKGCCYYSNNLILKDKNGDNRLLVQYSESYGRELSVNVKHCWISIKK